MATTILAIIATGAALPFIAGTQQIQHAAKLEQAVGFGEALMEEILARPFYESDVRLASPGPGAGETSRDLYNNMDAFDGLTESSGGLRDFQNTAVTDEAASGLWRSATVQYVRLPDQPADDRLAFVHIQVLVYQDGELLVRLDRLASRED